VTSTKEEATAEAAATATAEKNSQKVHDLTQGVEFRKLAR